MSYGEPLYFPFSFHRDLFFHKNLIFLKLSHIRSIRFSNAEILSSNCRYDYLLEQSALEQDVSSIRVVNESLVNRARREI